MNVRLICMDMDGTLFAEKESIPDKNIYALRRCAERGIHLALVSGRGNKYLRRVVDRIGASCAIASANGARIDATENGPTIFEGKFAEDEGKRIFKVLYDMNVNFEVYTRELNYVIRPEKIPERHRESLMRTGGMKDCVLLYDEESALKSAEIGAYKYVAFSDDPTEIERVRNTLDVNGIAHCSSGSANVEIMPTGVGKGNAVKVLNIICNIKSIAARSSPCTVCNAHKCRIQCGYFFGCDFNTFKR